MSLFVFILISIGLTVGFLALIVVKAKYITDGFRNRLWWYLFIAYIAGVVSMIFKFYSLLGFAEIFSSIEILFF